MPEKAPSDRKVKDEGFTFTVKGKRYALPKINEAAALEVPGGVTQDAIMFPDDETKQLALGFHMLVAHKPEPKAMAALRALPTKDMLEIVGEWMGEASGSSD